jgi:hypothetical protein
MLAPLVAQSPALTSSAADVADPPTRKVSAARPLRRQRRERQRRCDRGLFLRVRRASRLPRRDGRAGADSGAGVQLVLHHLHHLRSRRSRGSSARACSVARGSRRSPEPSRRAWWAPRSPDRCSRVPSSGALPPWRSLRRKGVSETRLPWRSQRGLAAHQQRPALLAWSGCLCGPSSHRISAVTRAGLKRRAPVLTPPFLCPRPNTMIDVDGSYFLPNLSCWVIVMPTIRRAIRIIEGSQEHFLAAWKAYHGEVEGQD